jgi:hypothetical protein
MITGPGEPEGEGEALGSGGGVTVGEGARGMRICGPPGAIGSGTYGAGVGEGEDEGLGAALGAADADWSGAVEGTTCATIRPEDAACAWATAAADGGCPAGGIPQPEFRSATACVASPSGGMVAAEAGGTVHSAKESATNVTPVRWRIRLIDLRARPASRRL